MAKNKKSADKSGKSFYENSSPATLAQQPSDPKDPKKVSPTDNKDWKILQGHLNNRLNSLRMWRQSWWAQLWAQAAQYINPRRSIWLTQSTGGWPSPNNMSRGKPINSAIVDPTGTYAMRVCSAGLMSGLASPSRPWFKLVPAIKGVDLAPDAREWMDEVEDRMYTILAGSNFYNSFAQCMEDLVVFGTAPIIIYEDVKDIIRCYNPVVGEYFLACSAEQRVDVLNRAFLMTVSQIVDFFGIDNCPEMIRKLWMSKGGNLNTEFIIGHSIEPNYGIGPENAGKLPGKFTWRETYWLWAQGTEKPLSLRGFVDQPFVVPRWSVQSNDAYGRSVGFDVLPDIINLQVETMRKAEAIEKQVRPPLLADMSLKNQPSSSLPGAVTYVNGLNNGTGMRSIYTVNPDISGMERDILAIQNRIKAGFFADLFLMLQEPVTNETAYSVSQRIAEKVSVLGPVVENIIGDGLKPQLKRIYSIANRKKMFPPMPKSMLGAGGVDVEFISLLTISQKGAAVGGVERLIQIAGNMAAVYPQVKDVINPDEVLREMNQMLNNPQKIINSEKTVMGMRQQEAQQLKQQQQGQQMEQAANTANVGAQAAQVMSTTQVGKGQSVLDALIGAGGGGV